VAERVNGKLAAKVAQGVAHPRGSDSQQFRQQLLDDAGTQGISVGQNQHGEYVVAMEPARFLEYLEDYRPIYHGPAAGFDAAMPSIGDLVEGAAAADPEPPGSATQPPCFDPAAVEESRKRVAREIAVRRGQAAFRARLIAAHGCCAMTGCTATAALEAAHVVRYQGPGSNHPDNGMLLRADVHTLFDLGLLAVEPDSYTILVAPTLAGSEYESLQGQPLRGGAAPSKQALRLHKDLSGL